MTARRLLTTVLVRSMSDALLPSVWTCTDTKPFACGFCRERQLAAISSDRRAYCYRSASSSIASRTRARTGAAAPPKAPTGQAVSSRQSRGRVQKPRPAPRRRAGHPRVRADRGRPAQRWAGQHARTLWAPLRLPIIPWPAPARGVGLGHILCAACVAHGIRCGRAGLIARHMLERLKNPLRNT